MNSLYIIAAFLLGLLASWFIIPQVIRESARRNLLDVPDHRKDHKVPTPTLGGIGLFAAFLISESIVAFRGELSTCLLILVPFVVLFMVGIKDDLKGMGALPKLYAQLALGVWIVMTLFTPESLPQLPFMGETPYLFRVVMFTIFIAGVTNAWNLIDGINGLSGSLGLINALIFGIFFAVLGEYTYSILAFGLAGGIVGFLRYNFPKASIFMGDTGSLHLGFYMALFSIKLASSEPGLLKEKLFIEQAWLWIMTLQFIPVFDCCRVFFFRILKHRGPFSPDRSHVHHLLLKNGMDHVKATTTLLIVHLLLATMAHTMSNLPLSTTLLFVFFCGVLLIELLSFRRIQMMIQDVMSLKYKMVELKKQSIRKQNRANHYENV